MRKEAGLYADFCSGASWRRRGNSRNANCIQAKISQKDARATEFLRTAVVSLPLIMRIIGSFALG